MKKQLQAILFSTLFISLLNSKTEVYAQGDVAEIVRAGAADATKLSQAYLNPLFKGIGFGMNSGWYNSAKTKNLGKFDLKIQATGAIVPGSDKSFDINSLGLTNSRPRNSNNSISPTAFGNDSRGPELVVYDNNGSEVSSFNLPSGAGIGFVPSPQVQLTVGLIKNTDVSVRFTPKVGGGDFGKIGSWGFGVKKEITSLLPGKSEKIIPIDIALAFGYNQTTYDYNIPLEDQAGGNGSDLNQRVEGKFSGVSIDAILSKKLAVFTPFIGVGYNSSKTDLGILGDYVVRNQIGPPTTITDPVKIKQTDVSGVRANVGFGLHMAFFRLYGAYSVGEYQAVTAGIGFGIGK
jgi:hypothetical protein